MNGTHGLSVHPRRNHVRVLDDERDLGIVVAKLRAVVEVCGTHDDPAVVDDHQLQRRERGQPRSKEAPEGTDLGVDVELCKKLKIRSSLHEGRSRNRRTFRHIRQPLALLRPMPWFIKQRSSPLERMVRHRVRHDLVRFRSLLEPMDDVPSLVERLGEVDGHRLGLAVLLHLVIVLRYAEVGAFSSLLMDVSASRSDGPGGRTNRFRERRRQTCSSRAPPQERPSRGRRCAKKRQLRRPTRENANDSDRKSVV